MGVSLAERHQELLTALENIKVFVGCHYSAAGACLSLLDPFTNTATAEKYLLVTLSAVYTANREEYYS